MQNNCIPPKKKIAQISVGNPATGSPHINVLVTIMDIIIIEMKKNNMPQKEEIANGLVEKAKIPSNEYRNKFQNDHFV